MCLDQWKRHNSSTGGYFKCNRYEVVKKVEDTSKEQIKEVQPQQTHNVITMSLQHHVVVTLCVHWGVFFICTKNGSISFEKISVLDSYFIHRYIII